MEVWYFEFTEEEKEEFKKLIPKELWNNIFLQRMYKLDPDYFKKVFKKKEEFKEILGRIDG